MKIINKAYKLVSKFEPSKQQNQSINNLLSNLNNNVKNQVLLGATGTGKTFTIANVIKNYNKQVLFVAHNKTLAMQLYYELKELFPENRVEYFVSNFDFYQPEAYIPSKDLYIDKDSRSNLELEMMRLSAVNALLTRTDTIVVSSVACIFSLQDPKNYESGFIELKKFQKVNIKKFLKWLIKSGYSRNEVDNKVGTFSVKGDVIKVVPGWINNLYYRISFFNDEIEEITILNTLTNSFVEKVSTVSIFPAQAYIIPEDRLSKIVSNIKDELKDRLEYFNKNNKFLEAERLEQRTKYDIESLSEFGYCSGIENYSSHLDFRLNHEKPYCLLDYFQEDFITIIDESHMTIPQIRAMYNTDRSRKLNLIEYGFRLPSAIDNRPLNFDEFNDMLNETIYVSATPGEYEITKSENHIIEQIIRPTGLLDPKIEVRKTLNQIDDIINEIHKRIEKNERVFITTLTIRNSEELTEFLQNINIKVAYMHSKLKTFERTKILNDLRLGVYDVVVGVNLLREGLDIPEVSLVCVIDADKEGFLRNARTLIQTVGRVARNANGLAIFYADKITDSMKKAIDETNRRRQLQIKYNIQNNITPQTIIKKVHNMDHITSAINKIEKLKNKKINNSNLQIEIEKIRKEMLDAAKELDFERAATLRDIIIELESK